MKLYYDNAGSWVEVIDIITFPMPRIRMDESNEIVVVIRDFQGDLYSTWNSRDNIDMKVTDGAGAPTTLFRGFISKKKFLHDKTTITISGFSKKLEYKPLNKNYILAQGIVSEVPSTRADLITYLYPNGNVTCTWTYMGWDEFCYDAINEDKDSIPDINGLAAGQTDDLEVLEFTMTTQANVTEVTSITLYVYCKYIGVGAPTDIDVDINLGGWQGYESITMTNGFVLRSFTWNGLSGSQADLNGLCIRIRAANGIGAGEEQCVGAAYCAVTYSGEEIESIELQDLQEPAEDFSWADDYWITDQDVGILIVDNTSTISDEPWECTAISQVNGNELGGDINSLDTKNDNLTYSCSDTTTLWNQIITPVMGGTPVDHTQKLDRIEIAYRWGCKTSHDVATFFSAYWKLQISNDGASWRTIKTYNSGGANTTWQWFEDTYTLTGTDAELAAFLNVDGADDYDEFKYIRLVVWGGASNEDAFTKIDYLIITVYYDELEISPIMEQIDGNGSSYITITGVDFSTNGVAVNDYFKIGQNTAQILVDIASICEVNIYLQSTDTKYIAQWFRGTYGIEVLKKVCLLEGWHWWEDHQLYQIVVSKEADFVDSTVDLTEADYLWGWEYEDDCNQYKAVEVFGSAALRIYYKAIDNLTTNTSPLIKSIIEETILTIPEAKDIADAQLLEYKVKRPSIRIPLDGVNADLDVGKTVTLTMVRPTVAEDDYPIRMIERYNVGISGIKTIIYCGLGHSTWEENLADVVNKAMYLSHKAHTDRLVSTPIGAGAALTWSDIGGGDAGAVSAVEATGKLLASKKITVSMDIINNNATEISNFFLLDDVNDYVSASFWCDTDIVDTTQNILFTWIYHAALTDAALALKKYQAAVKTDDSETFTWNIDGGTVENQNVTANKLNQYVVTFGAGDINGDDILIGICRNTDTTDVYIEGVFVTFYLK